jgi:hypothetical protein
LSILIYVIGLPVTWFIIDHNTVWDDKDIWAGAIGWPLTLAVFILIYCPRVWLRLMKG